MQKFIEEATTKINANEETINNFSNKIEELTNKAN